MVEKRRFVEDDLLIVEEHNLKNNDVLLLSGKHLQEFKDLNIKRGKEQALAEVKKIMNKLVRAGSGDIPYGEMIEHIKRFEKLK